MEQFLSFAFLNLSHPLPIIMSLTELPNQRTTSLDFLSGGGEMGERIRNFDWSKTPLGRPETWEQSLKTCVRIMLTSPQPMFVWWGKDLINIYNDAYRFVLGEKHPLALGAHGNIIWKEIWNEVGKRAAIVFNQNEGTFDDGLLLLMNRFGFDEETYFKFSYNPIPGERAVTAGLFCVCTEETERIINERSLSTLRILDAISQKGSEEEIYEQAASSLTFNNKDFPFGIIYKINDADATAKPVAFMGIESDQKAFPSHIDLKRQAKDTTNFCKAYNTREILISENAGRRKNLPTGFWQKEATHFAHVPIMIPGKDNPVAIISTALNPYRKFDSIFKQFVQLIADRIAIEVNHALNYALEKKKAEELAELDEAKTIFFSNISHEFRTPLTLMLGTIEEGLKDPNTVNLNLERMQVAHRNAMRLLKLVNTLLDFSRIESGRQKAIYALTDIVELTKNLAANFRSMIEKAGLKFIIEADRIFRPVYVDRQMWEKIVFNLLSNAFKYTLTGSITVKLFSEGDHVVFEISDTGVGIPEKELPHMFERFHRVQQVTGRTYEGTGIGLSLIKELIALHGGNIRVKSRVGEGSTFTVSIPFGKDHLPAEQTSEALEAIDDVVSDNYIREPASLLEEFPTVTVSNASNGQSATILFVDDNADMRRHIQSLLEKRYRVVTAANGMEALHKLRDEKPLVIVSDIMMPVMDGIQLLKEIKTYKETQHLPVILLTARAGEESKIEGYQIGADDYLVKPFSAKELIARIDTQIRIAQKRNSALQSIYNLFDEVPFAVAALLGDELIIDYVNKHNLKIWNQNREDVIGKPLFRVRPGIEDSVKAIHEEIYRTGNKFTANEIPVEITTNGKTEIKYFDAIIAPMFDEHGKIIGQLATSTDVTDKVLANKKIAESEFYLRRTTDTVPMMIWVTEKDGSCSYLNKRWYDTTGQTEAEALGLGWLNAVHPEDKDYAGRMFLESNEKQIPFNVLYRLRHKNGEYRWTIDSGEPRYDNNGDFEGYVGSLVDVHEEKVAEEKIKRSEERLRLVTDAMPSLIAYVDKNTCYQFNNKRYEEWFGIPPEKLRGKPLREVLGEEAYLAIEPHVKKALDGKEVTFESSVPYKSGGYRYILATYIPHTSEKNEVLGFYALVNDITEKKKSEEIIKESEEKNRLFIEYAPAAMAMFDKEMRYVSVSRQWMKEYDLTGDVLGKKHYDLFPNILQRWKDVHSRCLAGGVEKSEEDFYVKDDGTPVWLRWEVHPWYNATGAIGGIVIFTENITERKKSQQYIKESEERFRAMSEEAPLFVWETDEKLQTTYLNREGINYFALDYSFLMSELSWKKFIHPEDLDKVLDTMRDAADRNHPYTLEMRLKNGRTGEYRWFLDKGAPRYVNDKFAGFIGTSLDIHERKEIEKELELKVKERTRELDQQNTVLQKQNELVRRIFDASVDAIGVYDIEMKIITLNQAALDIYGKPASDLIGKKILDVLPQWEGSKGHRDLLQAISGETIHNKAYYSEVAERYYENFLMPLKDESGKVYAVLVMAHDNTELITSAKKLNEAQQIAQIGHWDWDPATNDLTWSDNLYKIYGVRKEEGINYEKFLGLVHPDDRKRMQANIELSIQSKTFNDFFHRIITPAGEEKIMHARGEVVTSKKGKILRLVGTGQDVTTQKMIEQELIATSRKIEERNQFIEQLINSSLDLIMVIDKDLRFITMNKKALELYKNYYKEDIIGKKITDFNPPLKGTENYSDLLEAFAGKVVIKDKVKSTISERYYEHNYVPLTNANSEVYAVMIISHDITESTRQMEELRKLYESDEQKTNFIAMASHELKTPITSIKGYVQLILNAIEKEKDRQKPLPPLLVRSSLLSVDKQIKRLTRLISELLDISKIETGTLELKKEKFSFNELAIETIEDILYTNTRHEINLYHDHHSDVFGDKDRLGQVMINFLTNAIKYSPDSEKIDVNIHKAGKDEIAFSVRDYGIGIDKEEQKKIFERFYRAKGKEEQTYPGFGIGLFIAKEFIQKHGGRIMVESEKGKGSIFTFILPVNTADL